jgi:hypothetical protein
VLDVHAPHEPIYSWRDFFIHLITITIGLGIALSLEGCVEWKHHKNLVHEAQEGLQVEIEANAKELQGTLDKLKQDDKELAYDIVILRAIIAKSKVQDKGHLTINFNLPAFDDVSWVTAKSTGALSYMPYDQAHQYSDIYNQQDEVYVATHQAVRDVVVSVAPFMNLDHAYPNVTAEEAPLMKQHIEVLQAQLYVVESLVQDLDKKYKKFLAAHPR